MRKRETNRKQGMNVCISQLSVFFGNFLRFVYLFEHILLLHVNTQQIAQASIWPFTSLCGDVDEKLKLTNAGGMAFVYHPKMPIHHFHMPIT